MASEKLRQQDQHSKCQSCLLEVEQKLKRTLNSSPRASKKDQTIISEFKFAFVCEDLDNLIDKYNNLLEIEKQYDALLNERNNILSRLGVNPSDENKPSVLEVLKMLADNTERDLSTLRDNLAKCPGTIDSTVGQREALNRKVGEHDDYGRQNHSRTMGQKAILNVKRKQLNDANQASQTTDNRVKHFEAEISKLKARIAELESSGRSESRHVGASVHSYYRHGRVHGYPDSHSTSHSNSYRSRHSNGQPHLHAPSSSNVSDRRNEIKFYSRLDQYDDIDEMLRVDDTRVSKRSSLPVTVGRRGLHQSKGIGSTAGNPSGLKIEVIETVPLSHRSGGSLELGEQMASDHRQPVRGHATRTRNGKAGSGHGNSRTRHGKGGKITYA